MIRCAACGWVSQYVAQWSHVTRPGVESIPLKIGVKRADDKFSTNGVFVCPNCGTFRVMVAPIGGAGTESEGPPNVREVLKGLHVPSEYMALEVECEQLRKRNKELEASERNCETCCEESLIECAKLRANIKELEEYQRHKPGDAGCTCPECASGWHAAVRKAETERDELKTMGRDWSELRDKLKQAEAQHDSGVRESNAVRAALAKATQDNAELHDQIARLRTECDQARAELVRMRAGRDSAAGSGE